MDLRVGLRITATAALAFFVAPSALAAVPDFAIEPYPPTAGDPVVLSAEDSGSTARWDLDDDGVFEVEGLSIEHVFAAPGPASVSMEAEDGSIWSTTFTVNAPPVPAFDFSPTTVATGQGVVFTSSSSDPDGDALEYRWDFGDGSFATVATVEHAFTTPGTKTITLTVSDADGATRSITRQVEVSPPPVPAPAITPAITETELAFMSPFPVVRLSGRVLDGVTVIRRLAVKASPGALVRVRCVGRDCPARSARRRVSSAGFVRFHRFERSLRRGTRLAIFVRSGEQIGKYTRFVIRAGKPPLRIDRCLIPGRRRPARCPTAG
jgi:hypothetical protein